MTGTIRVAGPTAVPFPATPHSPLEAVFGYSGPLIVTESERWYCVRANTQIFSMSAVVIRAGTTDTVVEVEVNDVVVGSLTIPAGSTDLVDLAVAVDLNVGDYITANVVTAGADAAGLTVQVQLASRASSVGPGGLATVGPAGPVGPEGPAGPTGPEGPMGPTGPAGQDADKTYVHTQMVPSATWTIHHNLNKRPSVTVNDNADNDVWGEVTYNDVNTVTIVFSSSFSGVAYLN